MRQAIQTIYCGPTNHRGARIMAKCAARTIVVEWEHGLDPQGNHKRAAEALASRLQWAGEWHGGFDRDGRGVFVVVDESSTFHVAREARQ